MRVVLDSSVIVADFHLKGASFRLLMENMRATGHSLIIPRVVIMESVNKFKERLHQGLTKLKSASDDLGRLIEKPIAPPTDLDGEEKLKELVIQYRRRLRWQLKERGARFVAIPRIPHDRIVRRDLARRKPFTETGKGYRDALIWETILAELRREPSTIAFVSHNVKDFAGTDKKLHQDLVNDLGGASLPADAVVLYDSLNTFVETQVLSALPTPHQALLRAMADRHPTFSLEQTIERELLEVLPGKELDADDLGLRSEYENPTVSMVGAPYEIEIEEEREFENEDERVLKISCKVDCYFDCYIFKSNYYCLPEDETPSVSEWNEGYFHTEVEAPLRIEAYATFDLDSGEITSFELLEAEGVRSLDY